MSGSAIQQVDIRISTANVAFSKDPGNEIAYILRQLALRFEAHVPPGFPTDSNGNRCGYVILTRAPD
jgi:hypothetical protein